MDKSEKRSLCTICITLFSLLHIFISAEQLDYSTDIPHTYSNSSDVCRQKREADDEDVINRFEMERVSPLFEIVRHLPPFEDNWLSSPVTIPTFPSFSSIKLENESSSFDEYKIEVIKDEEHVIGENGKQFKENSALNWYYSAESYSSVNNFTNHNRDVLQSEQSTFAPTAKTESTATETTIPKTSILRKQDDEHVVPSLKDGRGTFLDFNLLGSSTTPKVDSTTPPKNEEVKPNITTRYFLLQSGRVVAINVTNVSSGLKSTSSTSGQGNKNPLLPTFYFGSRIRNKDSTKASNNTNDQNLVKMTTTKPVGQNHASRNNHNTQNVIHFVKNNQLKGTTPPIENPQLQKETVSSLLPDRQSTKLATMTPNVEHFRPQKKSFTPTVESFTITPHVEYSKLKQISVTDKAQHLKQLPVTTKAQHSTDILSTKFPPQIARENTTLDPAQRWWSEMKAAKKERLSLFVTTIKPKTTTKAPKNVVKLLTENLEKAVTDPFYSKSFDSMKTASKEITPSTVELTANARSAKMRMIEGQALHFSTTPASGKVMRVPNPLNTPKWSTFSPSEDIIQNIGESSTKRTHEDLLEPSVPLSGVRHDFVRVFTLPPPITSIPSFKTPVSTVKPGKENSGSSRRPRYRAGTHTEPPHLMQHVDVVSALRLLVQQNSLSHVNLHAPKQQRIETSSEPSKKETNTFPSNYQLTTNSYRRPVNYQWWNTESTSVTIPSTVQSVTTPSARKSRPAFYLRNSVSFQTIPPGSFTDRRTLTSEPPNYDATVIESLQPPLEDLLIISFEPTRKSMGSTETKKTENLSQKPEKQNTYRGTAKTTKRPQTLIRNQERLPLSTAKPKRKLEQTPVPNIRSVDQAPIPSRSGNREGRHFRYNNPRLQNSDEKASTITSDISTTKQPRNRGYYFEPKRRRTKDPNAGVKNETTRTVSVSTERPLRSNSQRASFLNRGTEAPRGRNIQNNGGTTNTRRAKHLQPSSARELNPATDAPTTSKPFNQRSRSSPFIWHRPNVATVKSIT